MNVENPLITFVVACYNEEANIEATLDCLLAACRQRDLPYEILVMDDGSRDSSQAIIKRYADSHPECPIRIHVNHRNMGLGYNYFEGAFIARGEYYRLVCGDNVEPLETFLTVLDNVGTADVVAFFYPEVPGKARWRLAMSRLYTRMVDFLCGYKVNYYNGLAIHRRYNVMRWNSQKSGFSFQADLLVRVLDTGATIKQVSLKAHERTDGKSTAYSIKNILSVTHFVVEIMARRLVSALLYKSAVPHPSELNDAND